MISLEDVDLAYKQNAAHISFTPCLHSKRLSQIIKANVFLKLDNMQHTGSFKERGALNCLLNLSDTERLKGVVTASAGNHGQAVAYHASRLNIPSTIFMPINTPNIKVSRTVNFGADIRLVGENYDDSHHAAISMVNNSKAFYVHAYDDAKVINGQATIALEIKKSLPAVDCVVVSVGGGGLVAGIAAVLSKISPKTQVVGVEPSVLPSMRRAIRVKGPYQLPSAYTIADGIRVRQVGRMPYEICSKLVNNWAEVDDDQIAKAILFLLEEHKIVAEGAGAAGVAALLEKKLENLQGKTVCIVVGGGNIDSITLKRIIDQGMIKSARMIRLKVKIQDQPGRLSELLDTISKSAASVIEVHHERAFIHTLWSEVEVNLVLQTRGREHIRDILSGLRLKGYEV